MKGVLFPGDSRAVLTDLPKPEVAEGDVEIRLTASGICGTDLHYWRESPSARGGRAGVVPGHEVVGHVVSSASTTGHVRVGDRVVASTLHVGCGQCSYCHRGATTYCRLKRILGRDLNGSYGELVVVPERAVTVIPSGVSDREAVLLACNLSTAYSALQKANAANGKLLAVLGLGPVGLSAVVLARYLGWKVVAVDPQPSRRELAQSLGADWTLAPGAPEYIQEIRELDPNGGVPAVLECSGASQAQADGLRMLAPGGTEVLVGSGPGFQLDSDYMLAPELTITASGCCKTYEFDDALALLNRRAIAVEGILGPTFRIEDVGLALEHAANGNDGKVLFDWT
ncbi:MAG: alcohol dehydrogenase catalytic domain-containing protein [Actinomycetota bacterium]|nr:alcohol dehydrogenase catalytic domain-containing protein [Actinomycetota bacterium]